MLTFTLDLEEHRPDNSYPKRFPQITRDILDFLEVNNIRATVFVLGRLAENETELIREIASRGHELGFHSYAHVHLHRDTPENFREQTLRSKSIIEDRLGQPLYGFRAPAFSLTTESLWAIDILQELGFVYSSSVLPAANPINGFATAPARPFYWANGLLEIPAPVFRCGPLALPYLGGIYLRYLPAFLIRYFLSRESDNRSLWLYCHPHDFDYEEAYYTIAGTSRLTSLLLWFNRRHTYNKLAQVLAMPNTGSALPFIEQINKGEYRALPVFNPV